jgi:hypothetical protein
LGRKILPEFVHELAVDWHNLLFSALVAGVATIALRWVAQGILLPIS